MRPILLAGVLGIVMLFSTGCPSSEEPPPSDFDTPQFSKEESVPSDDSTAEPESSPAPAQVQEDSEEGIAALKDQETIPVRNAAGQTFSPKILVAEEEIVTPNNKRALVKIIVLQNLYKWKIGSMTEIERTSSSKRDVFTVADYVSGLQKKIKDENFEHPIIMLGMASHEFEIRPGASAAEQRQREEARANTRADNLGQACHDSFPDATLYTMNLGVHEPSTRTTDESADERRVIIIAVVPRDAMTDKDMEESIRISLPRYEDKLTFSPASYSLWPRPILKPVSTL